MPNNCFSGDVDPDTAAAAAEEDFDFLAHLMSSRELNALVKAHNVILFCNQVCTTLNNFIVFAPSGFFWTSEKNSSLTSIKLAPFSNFSTFLSKKIKSFYGKTEKIT